RPTSCARWAPTTARAGSTAGRASCTTSGSWSAPRSLDQVTGNAGLMWLARRETLRVSKLWTQTVLAPVISSTLFIVVFGLSLSGRIRQVEGFDYDVFIVPGLIAMT